MENRQWAGPDQTQVPPSYLSVLDKEASAVAIGAFGTLPTASAADAAHAALAAHAIPVTCCRGQKHKGQGWRCYQLTGNLPAPRGLHCLLGGCTWTVWAEAHPRELAVGQGLQGIISRGLRHPGEARPQQGGCRGEAGHRYAHPLADHLDDARREVAYTVCAPLALMDVALPAAIRMLFKHLL